MTWEAQKETAKKTLEKMIEMKHIVVNEYISVDGLAASIANDLDAKERELRENHERSQLFALLDKYYPDKIEKWFKEGKEL